MSQLVEKLKQVTESDAQPMGFRTVARTGRPRPLLVASLTNAASPGAADYITGADVVLALLFGSGADEINKLAGPKSGIIPGGRLTEVSGDELGKSGVTDLDFVVFPATSLSLPIFETEGIGRVLELETSTDSALLRAVTKLPVDAVLVGGEEQPLTWQRLMAIQRLADLVDKPLLITLAAGASKKELQTLWDMGISGFVVEVETGPKDSLKKLRRIVNGLEPSSRVRRGEQGAIVPPVVGQPGPTVEEEDGDFDYP